MGETGKIAVAIASRARKRRMGNDFLPDLLNMITLLCLTVAAGFNSLMVLILVGVLARVGMIGLDAPLRGMSPVVLFGVLTPLLMVAFTLDKFRASGKVLSRMQLVTTPAIAAIIAVAVLRAQADVAGSAIAVAAVIAGVLALVIHVARARARPVVGEVTQGIGIPIMSALEDLVAGVLTIAAAIAPLLALAFAGVCGYLFYRVLRRMQAQKRRLVAHGAEPAVQVVAVPWPRDSEKVSASTDAGKRGSVSR
jgi:hypothetical protein